jgi:hypothetical protein
LVHHCLTMTNIVFCIVTPFFLSRSNWMAKNIGSLASGLERTVRILGIGLKGLTKNPLRSFFLVHTLFHCRLCGHCAAKRSCSFAYSTLPTTNDTFGITGQLSPSSFRSSVH